MTAKRGSSPFLRISAKTAAIVASSERACELLRTGFDLSGPSVTEVLIVVDHLFHI